MSEIPCVGVGKKLYHVDGLQKDADHKHKVCVCGYTDMHIIYIYIYTCMHIIIVNKVIVNKAVLEWNQCVAVLVYII